MTKPKQLSKQRKQRRSRRNQSGVAVVTVVGYTNAGKSTLSNTLLGRDASIVSPEAGTTRDAVSARIDLAGLVVEWFDLPGVRATHDSIERDAIGLAQGLLRDATIRQRLRRTVGVAARREELLRVHARVDRRRRR